MKMTIKNCRLAFPAIFEAKAVNPGDTPAFSASLLTQFLVTGPFMLLTCIPPLRPIKGWLVASQYFYKAEEGKVSRRQVEN